MRIKKYKGEDFIMNTEKLVLRFGGENEIDLETLSISLNSTVMVLNDLAREVVSENDYCKFKVENIEKGSFIVEIRQILELAPALLPYVPSVLTTFKTILDIRKMLKGEKPKSISKENGMVSITSRDGVVYNANEMIFNIYTSNDNIEKELAKMSKCVVKDNARSDLSFGFQNEDGYEKIEMSKEELIPLSKAQDVGSFNENIQENIMITDIKIRKPDLIGDSKWQFVLNGKSIYADILDQEFLSKVHATNSNIKFHNGLMLKVELLVRYTDEKILGYRILKVIEFN